MGLKTKKGTKGSAAQYITRANALRKLQVSLASFRRLCIMKGIYPREPKRKLHGKDKTYYHVKDIIHLSHEPLIQKFRDLYVFERKYKRALGRREKALANQLVKHRPNYSLYHIVKERYHTLLDAIRDLDDPLSTIALFASLPANDKTKISAASVHEASELLDQFLFFCAKKRLVRKVFCSIKGFYIQVKYLGQHIIFLVPHQLPQHLTDEVDYNVLLTFLEFYCCMVRTVNFKLYSMEGWKYPPTYDPAMIHSGCAFLGLRVHDDAKTNDPSDSGVKDPEEKENETPQDSSPKSFNHQNGLTEQEMSSVDHKNDTEHLRELEKMLKLDHQIQNLFSGLSFFIAREVPRVVMSFLLTSCGALSVAWEGEGSPLTVNDPSITHHIVDRPLNDALKQYVNQRELVQPQWVFDCINSIRVLPVSPYVPGIQPPPHLSPFVEEMEKGYFFQQKTKLGTMQPNHDEEEQEEEDIDDPELSNENLEENLEYAELQEKYRQEDLSREVVNQSEVKSVGTKHLKKKRRQELLDDIKERGKTLLSKKHKRLLDRIEFGKERERTKRLKLQKRRQSVNQE